MSERAMNPGTVLGKVADWAASKKLSVFVLVMSITYVLILAVFGMLVEARWLDILAGLLPFQLLYALFFLNLILVGVRRVPAVLRQCQRVQWPQTAAMLSRFNHAMEVQGTAFRMNEFAHHLKRRGYQVQTGTHVSDAERSRYPATLLYACRGRLSPIGNLLFHASFLLILFGVVLNVLYRFEGRAIIAEGSPFGGSRAEYRSVTGAATAKLPIVDFDVEKIEADFWDRKLLFTRLEATLLHHGGRTIAKCSDSASVGNAAVTIDGYGYFPLYALRNRAGEIVDEAYVKLNLLSPAKEDHFFARGYPHKIYVTFYPDYVEVDGKMVNRSMNPVNPAYSLRIFRGRVPVYAGIIRPGEWADYDGLGISFPSYRKSGEFQIVTNPGHTFIWSAFILMVMGLSWKLLFYRKELTLWRDEFGRVWLAGRFDYYQKLNAAALVALARQFKEESA